MKKIKLLLSKNSKKKGGEIVFMLKRVLTILLVIVTIGLITELGYSVTIDSFEVYVTPAFYYSVAIDTRGAAMDFGPMTPNEVKWSTSPTPGSGTPSSATVLNNGNVTADLQIMAEKQSGTVWEASGTTKNSVGLNQCTIVLVLTTATVSISNINDNVFPDSALLYTDSAWRNLTNSFSASSYGATGDNVPVNDLRGIYVRMKAASDTTTTAQQKFRVNIRALSASTF